MLPFTGLELFSWDVAAVEGCRHPALYSSVLGDAALFPLKKKKGITKIRRAERSELMKWVFQAAFESV